MIWKLLYLYLAILFEIYLLIQKYFQLVSSNGLLNLKQKSKYLSMLNLKLMCSLRLKLTLKLLR